VQLHLVDSTYRPARHDVDHAEPSGIAPEAPSYVAGRARGVWNWLTPGLERLGILDELDQPALACLCIAVAEHAAATNTLKREGRYVRSPSGMLRVHPAVKVQTAAADTIRKFAAEFGLSPSARSRLMVARGVGWDDCDPEDDEFLGGESAIHT
jgi:P27 family predicted phage terminase small subunit